MSAEPHRIEIEKQLGGIGLPRRTLSGDSGVGCIGDGSLDDQFSVFAEHAADGRAGGNRNSGGNVPALNDPGFHPGNAGIAADADFPGLSVRAAKRNRNDKG